MQPKTMRRQTMKLLTKENLLSYTHIFWDFNGTIIDDVMCCINAVNKILSRRGMKNIDSVDTYRSVFCFPVINYYINMGFDFEKESFESISHEFIREYNMNVESCVVHQYVSDILECFKSNEIKQVILSASDKDNLLKDVARCELAGYFDDILGISNIYAKSKEHIGRQYIEKYFPEKSLIIGDTVHDYEVGTAIGADVLLVANGHQNYEMLSATGCEVIDKLGDLYEILQK